MKTKGIEVPRVENLIQSLLLLQGLISSKLCSSLSRSWLRREHNGFIAILESHVQQGLRLCGFLSCVSRKHVACTVNMNRKVIGIV